ncbi:MAG: hypothetical protein HQK52_23890 [Oligoflexia bacterium]|nr:hypothetical protein [Oligoflexia bacterium]
MKIIVTLSIALLVLVSCGKSTGNSSNSMSGSPVSPPATSTSTSSNNNPTLTPEYNITNEVMLRHSFDTPSGNFSSKDTIQFSNGEYTLKIVNKGSDKVQLMWNASGDIFINDVLVSHMSDDLSLLIDKIKQTPTLLVEAVVVKGEDIPSSAYNNITNATSNTPNTAGTGTSTPSSTNTYYSCFYGITSIENDVLEKYCIEYRSSNQQMVSGYCSQIVANQTYVYNRMTYLTSKCATTKSGGIMTNESGGFTQIVWFYNVEADVVKEVARKNNATYVSN